MTIESRTKTGGATFHPHRSQGLSAARQAVASALRALPAAANADLGEDVAVAAKAALEAVRKLEAALVAHANSRTEDRGPRSEWMKKHQGEKLSQSLPKPKNRWLGTNLREGLRKAREEKRRGR